MHGIGGRTIAEAKSTLSFVEFQTWCAYIRKRGSLNLGSRVEFTGGLLASMYANSISKRGNYKPRDFMPNAEEEPVTLENAMKEWR